MVTEVLSGLVWVRTCDPTNEHFTTMLISQRLLYVYPEEKAYKLTLSILCSKVYRIQPKN